MAFVRDPAGQMRWMHRGTASAQRRAWHASPWVQLPLHGLSLLVLIVASAGARVMWRMPVPRRQRLFLSVLAARLALLGIVGPLLYSLWVDHGQPPLMRPPREWMKSRK